MSFENLELEIQRKNNGVLFVIETDPTKKGNRDVYITVGQGLEGALPDGKIGRILDDYTKPFLEQGSVDDAVLSTYQVLYNEVAKEYGLERRAFGAERSSFIR